MKTNLAIAHEETFWPFFSSRDFSLLPDKKGMLVIVPITGFTDWEASLPLDFEENLLLSLLRKCLTEPGSRDRYRVLPPQRFNLGKTGRSFFTVDPETAHCALEEIVRSIRDTGFSKVLFLNSNPWNEDLIDCAGRDLRLSLQVQPFCINISSLGLDWHSEEGFAEIRRIGEDLNGSGSGRAGELARRLGSLLEEVRKFRPLPNNGAIPSTTVDP
jgi:hypothetical protein